MDRQTSLEYVHIQQNALEQAQRLIEREQAVVLKAARKQTPAQSGIGQRRRVLRALGARTCKSRPRDTRRRISNLNVF